MVNCGDRLGPDAIAATNPVIVVEVLSPGTTANDTGAKFADYFQISSIMHYLIVHPTRRRVIHHRRTAERIETTIIGSGAISMEPPGIVISLDEVYENGPSG